MEDWGRLRMRRSDGKRQAEEEARGLVTSGSACGTGGGGACFAFQVWRERVQETGNIDLHLPHFWAQAKALASHWWDHGSSLGLGLLVGEPWKMTCRAEEPPAGGSLQAPDGQEFHT